MNNDPNTQPGPGEFPHRVHCLDRVPRIHRGARLVREQVRVVSSRDLDPGSCKGRPLLLSNTQGRERFVLDIRQFEPVEGIRDECAIPLTGECTK